MDNPDSNATVTVVIPFYNGSKWIERALASVAQQTMRANEVVVVNDGSSAEEREALESLRGKYSIQIIDKANGGQGSARNAGVHAATSEYICFLDQDDFYIPEHIEMLVEAIPSKDSRFGFVYGDVIEADGDGNIVRVSLVKEVNSAHPKRDVVQMLRNDLFVLPSATLVKREAFLDVGGFDSRFMGYEDDDLFLRLFRKGYTNYFLDKAVYVWCVHGESTSYSMRMIRSRLLYFKKLVQMFPDDEIGRRFYVRDCLAPRFSKNFILDVLKSVDAGVEDRGEIISMFREFAAIVCENEHVGLGGRLKFRFLAVVFSDFPLGALMVFRSISEIRFIRRLFS